jgi:hypothetical protein
MSLDDYYKKRKAAQVKEATELVKLYRARKHEEPRESALHEFFWLFSDEPDELPEIWKNMNKLIGNEEFSKDIMRGHSKTFRDMSAFLGSIK